MEFSIFNFQFSKSPRGFTIFFAMLVGSLALAVGFAIYDLTVREIELSSAASQSQYAIYAADAGIECALYWDNKAPMLNGVPSVFGTSSASSWGATANCNGQNIVANGTPPNPVVAPPTGWSAWNNSLQTSSAATTTFTMSMLPEQPYCVVVEVGKTTISGVLYTTIISHGYNTCATNAGARLERTLRVSY